MTTTSDQLLREAASEIGGTVEVISAVVIGRSQDLALFALQRLAQSSQPAGALPPQAIVLAAQLRNRTMFAPVVVGQLATAASYGALRASLAALRGLRTRLAAWR